MTMRDDDYAMGTRQRYCEQRLRTAVKQAVEEALDEYYKHEPVQVADLIPVQGPIR